MTFGQNHLNVFMQKSLAAFKAAGQQNTPDTRLLYWHAFEILNLSWAFLSDILCINDTLALPSTRSECFLRGPTLIDCYYGFGNFGTVFLNRVYELNIGIVCQLC